MPRQLLGTAIAANTITTTQLQTTVVNQISAGGGPRVSSLIYPGNDTAGNTVGGQTVYINGSGFETNNAIYINGNAVPSKSFISASNLSFTTPALSAGIYPVYVINTDSGATAIFVPGYVSSAEPTWVTSAGSLSGSQDEGTAWSYTLSATGDAPITYALAAGSSLPGGISLAANGLISGTISSPTGNVTTYTFSVVATDAQNQDSTRQFTVTTSTGEGVLFANNVLLIHADGTNNGNNQQFVESSANTLTVTRTGSANQGSYSPFSQTGWSNYFDGNGDSITYTGGSSINFGTSDFTIELYVNMANTGTYSSFMRADDSGAFVDFGYDWSTSELKFQTRDASIATISTGAVIRNTWKHIAVSRSGTNLRLFVDGTQVGNTVTNSTNFASPTNAIRIGGSSFSASHSVSGHISNFRVVKGTAVYTSTFTPPTSALTAIANTSLLTCQSNRFIDNSTNAFSITRNGDTSIQAFSPFAPSTVYSTANNGGSVYIPSGTNGLTVASVPAIGTGNFTVEGWFWPTDDVVRTEFDSAWCTNVANFNGTDSMQGGVRSSAVIFRSNGTTDMSAAVSIANRWSHIAWVRNGTTVTIYVNGVSVVSGTYSNSLAAGNLYISRPDSNQFRFNGWISGFRILNTALYTGTFTPPTSAPTAVANTIALLNFTNAQIFDQTAKNIIETVGDAKVSTAQYKYGTASMVFDGTGDGVLVKQANENLKFGSSNFTIEGWVYFNTVSTRQVVFNQGWNTGAFASEGGFTLDMAGQTTAQLSLAIGTMNSGAFWLTTNASPAFTTGQWYHIALVRNGTTITIYRDGVSIGSSTLTSSTTKFANMGTFNLGIYDDGSLALNGYIDEVRLTKGYARYTSNFTPPTAALKDK